MPRSYRTFTVLPQLPQRLSALQALAYNLWWCWQPEAWELFSRVDSDLFSAVDHSPVRLLSDIDQERIQELESDDGFLAHLDRVDAQLKEYLGAKTWFQDTYGKTGAVGCDGPCVAYFSMEFGIHESIPVYSGGLGVLAGDHLKSASDLGVPLVGIGIMFREGYFRQYLNAEGWQQERYPQNDFTNLPLIAEHKKDGAPLVISVPLPGREVFARVWRIQVGRVPLYLLDTNIAPNNADDRAITAQLYGGDKENRIKQEIVLGIGGIRTLRALARKPAVCHLNEGHSAFCALERIRLVMDENKLDFASARELVKSGTCFTTHTPVPAGNEVFDPNLVLKYLAAPYASLGLDQKAFLGLGRQKPDDEGEPFGMTVLALKLANVSNGVSALHGEVSRKMWQTLWPDLPVNEVPITSITNGVHTRSWLAPEIGLIYDRYMGTQWSEKPADFTIWRRVDSIPDAELWRTSERSRSRLVHFARERLSMQLQHRGASPSEIAHAGEVLDPDALTIGFARRFATYKRGALIFRDLARLGAILNNKHWPVQIIVAGKAHPHDNEGKKVIAEVVHFAKRNEFRNRVVFIEDYDMNVARHLVQGVDVWLNNPRRPLEASGTSGMKVSVNGGLNFSVLDGWWVEGFKHDNGWAIGAGEEYADLAYQDQVEGRAIYDVLEQEIIPTFFNRGDDGVPREWVRRMKRNIRSIVPEFNTNRMVKEYVEKSYWPSAERHELLEKDKSRAAIDLAEWRRKVMSAWPNVRVESVEASNGDLLRVGGEFTVTAKISLGGLSSNDVTVELYHGRVDNVGAMTRASAMPMTPADGKGNPATYRVMVPCRSSGQYGYAVRVLPKHVTLPNPYETGLVTWGA
jgi:starch phosphorylase